METSILELIADAPYAALIIYMMWFASAIIRQAIEAQTQIILALIDRLPVYIDKENDT
jgi:hypothetical protein